ncbi:LysR substrate-binding domain-containing protein [Acerihabitans sp.]|uniref:LysR substrate-binding domain-containing protein n=1 Tax=Acerihabitans sp. TaxID=2811394 RepID=UPI002ED9A0BB
MEGVNQFRLTPSRRLRLNTSEAAARMILQPMVLEYLRRYPDMTVEIVADSRLVDIVADGFDAGIRLAESVPLDMIAVPCSAPLRFLVVGAPGYFALHGRPAEPGELARHHCIRSLLPSGAPLHWQFERQGVKRLINVTGALTLDNPPLMIDAALAGAGLAWVNESAAPGRRHNACGQGRQCPPPPPWALNGGFARKITRISAKNIQPNRVK